MKKLFLTLVALMPLLAMAQVKFTAMTFADAQKAAQKAGKELLVDVTRDDKDDPKIAEIFKNKELAAFINKNFIPVRINLSKEENKDFAEYLYSLMYPCVVFYSNRGEQLESTNWYSVATGKANLKEIAKKSMDAAAVKRANTRTINFRDLDFKQALEVAKKEGKLVFADNYTTWCRPCKQMEMDVFTLNSVADYYNEHFVSIKLDADKDPYKVAKNNGVRGFPGYLYFAPEGDVILAEGGFTPEKKFISYGERAVAEFNANKTINLLTSSLDEIKAQAKKEGKMIMVDLSATWCGPCKMMKKNIFTLPTVARFFNKNFVSLFVECDIEKEKAAQLKKLYGYSAFPTILFLNAEGELVHKMVGSTETGDQFIAVAKKALENKGLKHYNDRYAAGEKSPEFIKEYITVLGESYEKEQAAKVANDYLSALTLEQLATKDNYAILKDNISDMDAKPYQLFAANRAKFYPVASQRDVESYYSMLWYMKGRSFVSKGENPTLDKAGYKAFISSVKKSDLPADTKKAIQKASLISNAEMTKNWKEYISLIAPALKDGSAGGMAAYNWGLRVERNCEDKALRLKLAGLFENYIAAITEKSADAAKEGSMAAMNSGAIKKVIENLKK
ncbi:MAG: thioredoxin family protein [Rikenellaceae bacterium]